jgi:hypothetical protein
MISSAEMRQLNEMFGNQLSVLEKERKMLPNNTHGKISMRSSTEVADSFEDRQEFTIDKGSTETMCQCIIDP